MNNNNTGSGPFFPDFEDPDIAEEMERIVDEDGLRKSLARPNDDEDDESDDERDSLDFDPPDDDFDSFK